MQMVGVLKIDNFHGRHLCIVPIRTQNSGESFKPFWRLRFGRGSFVRPHPSKGHSAQHEYGTRHEVSYLIHYDSSLQNVTEVYYKSPQDLYHKMRQFYYKMRQLLQIATILLQNATVILQNGTFITNCDSTLFHIISEAANETFSGKQVSCNLQSKSQKKVHFIAPSLQITKDKLLHRHFSRFLTAIFIQKKILIAFSVSELLRENQQRGKTTSPHPPRLGLMINSKILFL